MSQSSDRPNYYDLTELTALVVDDNRHVLELIGGILESFGLKGVHKAASVESALAQLKNHSVDLIITDWAMEPLDGIELVRKIRRDGTICDPKVPIIMLTGHTEMERVIKARDAGVTDFLAKPITPKAIYDRIVSLIEKPATDSLIEKPATVPLIEKPATFVRAEGYVVPDRRRKDKAFCGAGRRRGVRQGQRGLNKYHEIMQRKPVAVKHFVITVIVMWLFGAGLFQFTNIDPPNTVGSTIVQRQAVKCKGSFEQRYECTSGRRIAAQQQAFYSWISKLTVVFLPPLVILVAYRSVAHRSHRGKKTKRRSQPQQGPSSKDPIDHRREHQAASPHRAV